jgi:hypothetical protein
MSNSIASMPSIPPSSPRRYRHRLQFAFLTALKHIWKALPGWIMLTRRHAEEILQLPSLVDSEKKDLVIAWNSVHAPEEVTAPPISTSLSLPLFLSLSDLSLHTLSDLSVHRSTSQRFSPC